MVFALEFALEKLGAIRAKQRLTSLESAVGGLKRDNAAVYEDIASQHGRYDRLAERIERLKNRLDITD